MKTKMLYALWGCLYILCVGLGTVEEPQGIGKALLVLTALVFFVPGGILLYTALRENHRKRLVTVRVICCVSLGLTLCMLVANMFSVCMTEEAGQVLHDVLGLVSAPMLCSQYWVGSIFLWACLLFASFLHPKSSD